MPRVAPFSSLPKLDCVLDLLPRESKADGFSFLGTSDTHMATGTVKWFNAQKGYGFIQPSDGGKDVFVHITAVERAGLGRLVEGQKITYDLATDRGKTAAANLKLA